MDGRKLDGQQAAKCVFIFKPWGNTLFRFMCFSKIKHKDDIINKDVEKYQKNLFALQIKKVQPH